tara:strand:+ start:8660 stop:9763 length:1104 start_codon:yes stop_codon:yes gene_type:complete
MSPLPPGEIFEGSLFLKKESFTLKANNFQLPKRGLSVLFGDSGSGKTTFLRSLSGLEKDVVGRFNIGEGLNNPQKNSIPLHKRNIGYVFQGGGLFPHLNVHENLNFGLKRSKEKSLFSYDFIIRWFKLEKLLKRKTETLSGGEKQKVAIARTLLQAPDVLFMDEPLSGLDRESKLEVMKLIGELKQVFHGPILMVTHSFEELKRLADFVFYMEKGAIKYLGSLLEAMNDFKGPLIEKMGGGEVGSVLEGVVKNHLKEDALTVVDIGGVNIICPQINQELGQKVRVLIESNQVALMESKPKRATFLNALKVKITEVKTLNQMSVLVGLKLLGGSSSWPLYSRVTLKSFHFLKLSCGQTWVATIKATSL